MSEPTPAAPIAIRVTRYRCPACPRSHSKRAAALAHIGRCWHIPANRACLTCRNFEPAHDACGCEPGCNWGGEPVDERCAAGYSLPAGHPVANCDRWEPKDDV